MDHFQFPQPIELSPLLVSKPLSPLPLPQQFRNQIPVQMYNNNQFQGHPQQYVIHNGHSNGYYPVIPQGNVFQNRNYGYPHQHVIPTSIPGTVNLGNSYQRTSNMVISPGKSQQGLTGSHQGSRKMEQRPLSPQYSPIIKLGPRPKSPKIEFKYASPPKNSKQLSEIRQLSGQSGMKAGSLLADQSLSLKPKQKQQPITIKQQIQSPSPQKNNNVNLSMKSVEQNVTSSIKNSAQNRSSINNYIYLAENGPDEKVPKPQQAPSNRDITKEAQKMPQQAMASTSKFMSGYEQYQNKQRQQQMAKESRLKEQDKQLKEMLKQYENLKTFSYNDSNGQLPRVEKNSSEENEDEERDGSSSGGNRRSSMGARKELLSFGVISDKQSPLSRQKEQIRFPRENGKKQNKIIREQSQFVIQGIQNVKSQVFDQPVQSKSITARLLKPNSSQKQYHEDNEADDKETDYRVREKEVEIKNLKNQMWLMRLRENQLLARINKLEQINRGQELQIRNLKNRQ